MTKIRIIILIAIFFGLLLLFLLGIGIPRISSHADQQPQGESLEHSGCQKMYEDIERELEEANFCEEDSDCAILRLGGRYIRFGCYKFVNKDVDQAKLYEKIGNYYKQCSKVIDRCAPSPKPVCVGRKCAPKRQGAPAESAKIFFTPPSKSDNIDYR